MTKLIVSTLALVFCTVMVSCQRSTAHSEESRRAGVANPTPRDDDDAHESHGHDRRPGAGGHESDDHEHRPGAGGHASHDHEHRPGAGGHESHGHEHDAHDDDDGMVLLSNIAVLRSGIVVETAGRGTLEGIVEIPAEVQLNPDRVAHISPLVEGQIADVRVSVGDLVAAKQPLAKMRSVELGQARSELRRTTALLSVAKKTLERQLRLHSEGINSERNLLEAQLGFEQVQAEREAAQSRLLVFGVRGGRGPDMILTSPIAGAIVERHATQGETVSPGDPIFVVADLSRVWVMGRVYEQQISAVVKGMGAVLTLNAHPARSWAGRVDYVGVAIDEATRTLPIRVELDNADRVLRPGLFGTLRLSADLGDQPGVIVPSTAIQTMADRTVVFVPGEHSGSYRRRYVTVGRKSQGRSEIIEGLSAGAPYVVKGAFVLKSELMRGELGHGHAH